MATAQVAPRYGQTMFENKTFNVMLTTSGYTFDEDTHRYRSSVTNEVTGTGYTAGGKTLSVTVGYDADTNTSTVTMNSDVTWTSSSITNSRQAVIYESVGSAATDPLVGVITFDDDESSTAEGVFTLTAASTPLITFQSA